MKKVAPIILIAVSLIGCNDTVDKLAGISKPRLRDSNPSIEVLQERNRSIDWDISVSSAPDEQATVETTIESPTIEFPILRTLTDLSGRSIEAKILAKKGNRIAIAKLPSNQPFILPLDKLAQADRLSLSTIPDGGEFEAAEISMKSVALPASRKAVWHPHITSAEKEGARFGIPLLVAVLVNGSSSAADLEKSLAYSTDFKSWADRNIALCMIRTDGFTGAESRESTFETWVSLQKYGIHQSSESSLILTDPTDFTTTEVANQGASTGNKMIALVETEIREKSRWSNIVTADAPVRATSPFKVHSRPMSNSGST